MKSAHLTCLLCAGAMLAVPAAAQTPTAPCGAATLNGVYSLGLNGRIITLSGALNGIFEGLGTATFDGASKVTFSGTANTPASAGQSFTYSGTYTLPSNCMGTITLTTGDHATFALVVWSGGAQFDFAGTDTAAGTTPVYVWAGNGSNVAPQACATASVSGPYTYSVTGIAIAVSAEVDAANEAGTLMFDGQGSVTAAASTVNSSQSAAASGSSTGAYTVNSNCTGSLSMKDAVSGVTRTLNFVITGQHGENLRLLESTPAFIGTGTAHNAFSNPSQSIANVANYAYSATPPGSVFVLFGVNLAPRASSAQSVPLPTTLAGVTSVTVNGVPVPLFYADGQQIDAQMPWEVPGNTVASVVVKNGSATSNAAAVYVPATGTPGLSFTSGTNRAVIVNQDGTVNAGNNPAAVNDEVVAYFTGGGPVNPSGKLTTGAASPAGLSPVTDANASVTVGGAAANVIYIGLTPGSVGLYQANFKVPQVAKGTYPVVITISGTASNTLLGSQDPNPVMTVSN